MKIRNLAVTTSFVTITALALTGCAGGGGDRRLRQMAKSAAR